MAVLSWTLLGLASAWANATLYADRRPSGLQPGMLAVAVIGGVFGGLLGSAFGLGSVHEMIDVGTWLTALVWSGALLSIYNVVVRIGDEGPWDLD